MNSSTAWRVQLFHSSHIFIFINAPKLTQRPIVRKGWYQLISHYIFSHSKVLEKFVKDQKLLVKINWKPEAKGDITNRLPQTSINPREVQKYTKNSLSYHLLFASWQTSPTKTSEKSPIKPHNTQSLTSLSEILYNCRIAGELLTVWVELWLNVM